MLILDGKPLALPGSDKVVDNIVFKPGSNNTFKQRDKWAGMGLHWTGAENPSSTVINTLTARGLSVQFILDKDGQLVQTADLNTRCAHIGTPGNSRFIGVETVCRGFATKADLAEAMLRDPSLRERTELDWASPRDLYEDHIGDRRVKMAGFNPEQLESLIWLCETMSTLYSFPRAIPVREVLPTGKLLAELPMSNPEDFLVKHDGKYWLPSMSRSIPRARSFRGVLGHSHINNKKNDPGSQIFYALWAAGWNPSGKSLSALTQTNISAKIK